MEHYAAIKNNEFMKLLGEWVEVENVILSEDDPITEEHAWYALTDKWTLAQKLGIPKIQFADHMKLKKKEDQSMGALVLLRRGNKILMGTNMKTKHEAETEGKGIQRLPHQGIHPIHRHQTQALLWTPRNPIRQELDIAAS